MVFWAFMCSILYERENIKTRNGTYLTGFGVRLGMIAEVNLAYPGGAIEEERKPA